MEQETWTQLDGVSPTGRQEYAKDLSSLHARQSVHQLSRLPEPGVRVTQFEQPDADQQRQINIYC